MIFLIPYAYDRMPDGKPLDGVPVNRLGSKARCDALITSLTSFLKTNYTTVYNYILSAGYSKENPDSSDLTHLESIAQQMAKYLQENGCLEVFVSWHLGWGTYQETLCAIKTIRWQNSNGPREAHIYVSTNLGHMPRVWLCWFFMKPKYWKVHFVRANHSFTTKEYFQETWKFFVYLFKFIFKQW